MSSKQKKNGRGAPKHEASNTSEQTNTDNGEPTTQAQDVAEASPPTEESVVAPTAEVSADVPAEEAGSGEAEQPSAGVPASETEATPPTTTEAALALLRQEVIQRYPAGRRMAGDRDGTRAALGYSMIRAGASNLEVLAALIKQFDLPPANHAYPAKYRAHLVMWEVLTKEQAAATRGPSIPSDLKLAVRIFDAIKLGASLDDVANLLPQNLTRKPPAQPAAAEVSP